MALLNELGRSDIDWFLDTGVEEQVISGKVLITEGRPSEHVFLVLEGLLSATLSILEGRKIGDIGPGELVGEYSFLSGETPSATVAAAENSLILAIAKDDLDRKLEADTGFAARLYRGFASRIRASTFSPSASNNRWRPSRKGRNVTAKRVRLDRCDIGCRALASQPSPVGVQARGFL